MSQYEINMVYIPGPDNSVADALSQLLANPAPSQVPLHTAWNLPIGAILSISTDKTILESIRDGYATDKYCIEISKSGMPGTKCINGLWYIGDRLLIPCTGDICENLFYLAHDSLGILVLTNVLPYSVMLTTGHTCSVTLRHQCRRPCHTVF
jgi:hypothetical protein